MNAVSPPCVSIGLPVYNGGVYLKTAIESLLQQDYADFELIISDNASTDATGDICRKYAAADSRIRYFCNETNIGAVGNFRRVLELARGRYFMWAAHDDAWRPDCLGRLVQVLDSDPDCVLCASDVAIIDRHGVELRIESLGRLAPHQEWGQNRRLFFEYPTSEVLQAIYGLYRTEILRRCKPPSANGRGFLESGETPLLAELSTLGKICAVPRPLKYYRRHEASNYRTELKTKSAFDHLLISLDVVRKLLLIVHTSELPFRTKSSLAGVAVGSWCKSFVRASKSRLFNRLRIRNQPA